MTPDTTIPDWWNWDLTFTGHAELRMEQRGVSEVDARSMLERATNHRASVVAGRSMIEASHNGRPWIAIVEPDPEAKRLIVVTTYEVTG